MLQPPPGYTPPSVIRLDGKEPQTGARCDRFRISVPMLEALEKNGPTTKFFDALLVPETIESPDVVFEGLNRGGLSHGLCYSRVPTERWQDAQTKIAPPPSMVFLVFIRPIGTEF